MISKKIEKALNLQINAELYSAYLYLSMEAYFKFNNLPGFANWMRAQTLEEMVHAMKIHDFVNECGGRVTLGSIEEPPTEWESPMGAFKAAYEHEQGVTAKINNLVNQAIQEKDHATNSFLQWFVNEQVEEEASVNEVLRKLEMAGDSTNGLFMIDHELAQRRFQGQSAGEE